MGKQLDFQSIYMLVIFILPGFLARYISVVLYEPDKKDNEIEIIYKSVLFSGIIYVILYVFATIGGANLQRFTISHPIWTIVIILLVCHIWGFIIFLASKNKPKLYKLLTKLKLSCAVEPPNIHATLFDPKYQPRAKNGFWLTFSKNNIIFEGFVKYVDVANTERFVYVVDVRELDQEGKVNKEYPKTFGILLDLRKVDWIDINYGE